MIETPLPDRLRAAFDQPTASADLPRMLAAAAEREGLLDIAYCVIDSPYGSLLLAASRIGLLRVAFEVEDHDVVLARLSADVSPRLLSAPDRLTAPARQLGEYFAGRRRRFALPLDLRLARGFRRTVLEALRQVGYGATLSYAALAAAAGNPRAVRAAAGACSHNPIPIVVPCHRVVRSDGSIGQYLGGPEVKTALLSAESR